MDKKELLETIARISGTDARKCMKCGKCSGTCPAYDEMEYHPHQFVAMVEQGKVEPLMASKSLYMCLSCLACVERCPRGVEPAKFVEAVRLAVIRQQGQNHMKQDEIADRVAKSRTAVTNSMRLLKLTSKVQEMVIADMISAGHARALLGISDETLQENTAMKVFDEKLSVRETEKLVKNLVSPAKKEKTERNTAEDAIYESLEEKMKGIMGTKVSIQRKKNNKGKIEIEYYSRDELERIIDLFESIR